MDSKICLGSCKGSHLIPRQEYYQQLLTTHPHTEDGCIHVVGGIVNDETGRIYLHHNAKLNEFLLPGGKVEQGETYEQALMRELKEELNIEILDATHLSSVKYIAGGIRRCFHMFQVGNYTGTLIHNEADKFDQYRAKKVDSDNRFGFAISIDGTITDDEEDIMQSFIDLYHLWVVVPSVDQDLLLSSTYTDYDVGLIDPSRHYYLWLDQQGMRYFLK